MAPTHYGLVFPNGSSADVKRSQLRIGLLNNFNYVPGLLAQARIFSDDLP